MNLPKGAIVTQERPFNELPPLDKERIAKWWFQYLSEMPDFQHVPDAFRVLEMLEIANPLVIEYRHEGRDRRKLRFSKKLFRDNLLTDR